METQEQLLTRFKKTYHHLSYSRISKLSGIQQTRVFRIFNGHELKISEYLGLKSLLDGEASEFVLFDKLMTECKGRLTHTQLDKLSRFASKQIEFSKVITNDIYTEIA